MISIFVAKLDFGVSNVMLRQLFENYGTVLKATVATDRETGKPRGFAFVEMADRQEAERAIQALDGHVINDRALAVKEAEQRTDNRPANKTPYSPRENSPTTQRPTSGATPSAAPRFNDAEEGTPSSSFVLPKTEPRKKAKEKDRKTEDDNRNKKPKMDAYKKSGKNPRFFDDDDDLDDELLNYKKTDDEDLLADNDEDNGN